MVNGWLRIGSGGRIIALIAGAAAAGACQLSRPSATIDTLVVEAESKFREGHLAEAEARALDATKLDRYEPRALLRLGLIRFCNGESGRAGTVWGEIAFDPRTNNAAPPPAPDTEAGRAVLEATRLLDELERGTLAAAAVCPAQSPAVVARTAAAPQAEARAPTPAPVPAPGGSGEAPGGGEYALILMAVKNKETFENASIHTAFAQCTASLDARFPQPGAPYFVKEMVTANKGGLIRAVVWPSMTHQTCKDAADVCQNIINGSKGAEGNGKLECLIREQFREGKGIIVPPLGATGHERNPDAGQK